MELPLRLRYGIYCHADASRCGLLLVLPHFYWCPILTICYLHQLLLTPCTIDKKVHIVFTSGIWLFVLWMFYVFFFFVPLFLSYSLFMLSMYTLVYHYKSLFIYFTMYFWIISIVVAPGITIYVLTYNNLVLITINLISIVHKDFILIQSHSLPLLCGVIATNYIFIQYVHQQIYN